jgi:quercetin dioxygenase-like cupin family protein
MEAMMRPSKLMLVAAVAILAIFVGTAIAAHRPPPTVEFVSRGRVGPLDASNQRVRVERTRGSADHAVVGLTFTPGSSTGWHRHPGVVLVTINSGRIQHVDSDCNREVFEAGDTFVEEGGIHIARNLWDEDAVVYATWIMPSWKEALTVPTPAPRGCPIH